MNPYSTAAALQNYPTAAQMAVSPFVVVNAAGTQCWPARTLAAGRALVKADERGNACRAYGQGAKVMSRQQYERLTR